MEVKLSSEVHLHLSFRSCLKFISGCEETWLAGHTLWMTTLS